ncbi:MAG: LVIVD repeat-containing protein [Flavobacteriaceae bacterium]
MKKYLLAALFAVAILACSEDSSNAETSQVGTGGSLAIFALKGHYLYTVDNNALNVFSLINEAQPVKVNEVFVGFSIETLFSDANYLYIGSREGMYIYNIENPEAPKRLAAVQHLTACDPVVSNGQYAFVTLHSTSICGNNTNVLEVYDVSSPTSPSLLHSRNLTAPKGLGLYNDYLFVCDDVIKIFDVSTAKNPVLVHSLDKVCFDVIIKENTLFAIGENGMYRYQLNENDIADINLKSALDF